MATATSKYLNRSTPNVYITEIDAFGTSIVGVPTGVPVFIGYTQFAGDPVSGKSLYNQPVQISSMTEYANYFGGPAVQPFSISPVTPPATPNSSSTPATSAVAVQQTPDFYAAVSAPAAGSTAPSGAALPAVDVKGFMLTPMANTPQFNLYWQMRLFFANGGGNCYIVSAGSYWSGAFPVSANDPVTQTTPDNGIILGDTTNPTSGGLYNALNAAGYAKGPTMTVIPEMSQLYNATASDPDADYGTLIGAMLTQAATLQDRVAIIDLPQCTTADNYDAMTDRQNRLWTELAPYIAYASYGAAYGPALNTSIVSKYDVLYSNLIGGDATKDNALINNILTTQAFQLYGNAANPTAPNAKLASVQQAIAAAFPIAATTNSPGASGDPGKVNTTGSAAQLALDNLLLNALPIFAQIEQQIANKMNIAPPSGAMAGVWNKSDVQSGVWNAPANIALASVVSPLYDMSDAEQGGFNVPTNGQAIDIIRAQPGRGNVVWGARTLDGNSQDYRYIQVRRTLIYVEQTIKLALQSYVFAANDAITWTNVTSSISAFLTGLWQQGGLMGAKSTDAFTVNCGLGATMTAQDVLNGYMVVAVTLQMIHPAEFIELTFTQTMGS
jgi:phage tail sheath protein FI